MKWLGFRQVAVKSIRVDAVDIKRRMKLPHVAELADDIRQRGGEPIHAPTVRAGSNELLCGRDRFAASIDNKAKKLWVHLVECDDQEAKELELAENIYRRADNRAELIAQLVRLKEQHLRAEDEAKRAAGEKVSAASQDSPKARARREVAKAAGVSQATVKSHEKHARKSAEKAENDTGEVGEVTHPAAPVEPSAPELPAGFQAYGLEVGRELADGICAAHAWLSTIEGDARRIVGEITKLGQAGRPVAHAHLQAMRQQAQTLGHAIREAIPVGLCPYCKAQPALVTDCNGCGATGVVGRHTGDHVPRELLGTAPVTVAVNGHIVPLADAAAALKELPKPKKKGGKPIHVEVIDEVGAAPRELTIDRTAAEESEELF